MQAQLEPDTLQPLARIRSSCTTPLVHALLDASIDAGPADPWIDSLECLHLSDGYHDHSRDADYSLGAKRRKGLTGPLPVASSPPKLLTRRVLYPLSAPHASRDYVAVSYTWGTSADESTAIGGYLVQDRHSRHRNVESVVRDNVWDRVLRFADYVHCPNIWIDKECIDQDDKVEKQVAMQSMHLVYSLSRCPVALLACTFTTETQLRLLANLLNGEVQTSEQAETVKLLQHVTSSLWWNRAWTFQEDYRATTRIKLLIPHAADLEAAKRGFRRGNGKSLFGALSREIIIKSVDFKRQATKFCMSYQKQFGLDPACMSILETAGRYTELLREGAAMPGMPAITRSMSPTIFADVCKRGISEEPDRLAIISNCCEYDIRLAKRSHGGQNSLSILLLTLFLINGEVMENDPTRRLGTLEDSALKYLEKQSLRSFRPVIHTELTFIKRCRFIEPRLTASGIATKGHLWRLGRVIRGGALTDPELTATEVLQLFLIELRDGTHGRELHDLADHIDDWVGSSSQATNASFSSEHPSSQWRDWMANQIAQYLREGKALRLGTLVDATNTRNVRGDESRQPSAIFTRERNNPDHSEDDQDGDDDDDVNANYVFTSFRWAANGTDTLDKHISLQVRLASWTEESTQSSHQGSPPTSTSGQGPGDVASSAAPRLYIDRWVNGLCFFEGHARQEVVFPLPTALTE